MDLSELFANLRKKNVEFIWSEKQQEAFDRLKVIIAKKTVVKTFHPNKDIMLTTDANEHSISGILSQEGYPIMYLSRRLVNTEFNYSNIKKETLAILWITTRSRQFLIGKKFLLISDHRPLEFIFNPRKELPQVTTLRILRWAIRLIAFDFDIKYVKRNSILHIDALSRLRFYKESKDKTEEFEDTFLHLIETDVLSLDRMAVETRHDPVLSRITLRIRKKAWGKCFRAKRPYKEIRRKLTIEHGVLSNGDLIIPPETKKIGDKSVHDDIYCGVAVTQKRIKSETWWPGYSRDIEEYIKRCKKCKNLRNFTQTTLH